MVYLIPQEKGLIIVINRLEAILNRYNEITTELTSPEVVVCYTSEGISKLSQINHKYVINHKVIKCDDKIDILYDPLNIIFDYKVRDVAEYIKISFFNKNQNIFNELVQYLKYSNLSLVEVKLLISRLLYPSFYFELYEDILINSKEEKIILDIVSCLDEYEEYLDNIFSFLKQYFNMYENIDEILWLKKRRP